LSSPEPSSNWQAGEKENREVLWLAVDGRPIPQALATRGIAAPDLIEVPDRPTAFFVPVEPERLGSAVRELRRALGEQAYVVIAAERLSPEWCARAIALGADDVVNPTSGEDAALCLPRTRRSLSRLRAACQEGNRLAPDSDYPQACIEPLPAPICFKNAAGIYVGCHTAFAGLTGRPTDGVVGRPGV